MAFTYTVVAESDLLVGWGWGRITADEIVEAARLLPSLPGYRAGIDRITVIHPDALLSEMSPAALRDLRATCADTTMCRTGPNRRPPCLPIAAPSSPRD